MLSVCGKLVGAHSTTCGLFRGLCARRFMNLVVRGKVCGLYQQLYQNCTQLLPTQKAIFTPVVETFPTLPTAPTITITKYIRRYK